MVEHLFSFIEKIQKTPVQIVSMLELYIEIELSIIPINFIDIKWNINASFNVVLSGIPGLWSRLILMRRAF